VLTAQRHDKRLRGRHYSTFTTPSAADAPRGLARPRSARLAAQCSSRGSRRSDTAARRLSVCTAPKFHPASVAQACERHGLRLHGLHDWQRWRHSDLWGRPIGCWCRCRHSRRSSSARRSPGKFRLALRGLRFCLLVSQALGDLVDVVRHLLRLRRQRFRRRIVRQPTSLAGFDEIGLVQEVFKILRPFFPSSSLASSSVYCTKWLRWRRPSGTCLIHEPSPTPRGQRETSSRQRRHSTASDHSGGARQP
jgi:hypothetical protein